MFKQKNGSASSSSSYHTFCCYPVSPNMKYRQAGVIFEKKNQQRRPKYRNAADALDLNTNIKPWGLWKCSFMSEVQNSTLGNTGYLKIRLPH